MPRGRPPIPVPLQRRVRQHCGFGCVICGCPIYQIDHIIPWERVKCHRFENLVTLCPNHHTDKTCGRLAESQVFVARSSPYNTKAENTASYRLMFSGEE